MNLMNIKIQKSTIYSFFIFLVLDLIINSIGIFNEFFSDTH